MKILLLIVILIMIISCNGYRTPSKERFETACDIQLPKNFKIERDDYQDMNQDFVLYYTLELDSLSMQELAQNIRKSKYYRSEIKVNNGIFSDKIFPEKSTSVWIRTMDGYIFRTKDDRHSFIAIIDTISKKAKFTESLD